MARGAAAHVALVLTLMFKKRNNIKQTVTKPTKPNCFLMFRPFPPFLPFESFTRKAPWSLIVVYYVIASPLFITTESLLRYKFPSFLQK